MARDDRQSNNGSSVTVFLIGVVVGGLGGGLAGWLLGGHIAPLLTGLFNLVSKDSKRNPVHFEAMQQ